MTLLTVYTLKIAINLQKNYTPIIVVPLLGEIVENRLLQILHSLIWRAPIVIKYPCSMAGKHFNKCMKLNCKFTPEQSNHHDSL